MVRIERDKSEKMLSTFVSDQLTEEDYVKIRLALQQSVNEWYGVRWYLELRNFAGWEGKAPREALKLEVDNAGEIARVAMVVASKWEEWLDKAMKPFNFAEFRYFTPAQQEEARQWLVS